MGKKINGMQNTINNRDTQSNETWENKNRKINWKMNKKEIEESYEKYKSKIEKK